MRPEENRVCDVLRSLRSGIPSDSDVFDYVLDRLRRLARRYMSRQHGPHMLQTTALMHDAYVHLFDRNDPQWNDSSHFFNAAARVMQNIIVDHARRMETARKHGHVGGAAIEDDRGAVDPCFDIIAIDDCIDRLSAEDPRMVEIVRLHVFGGRTLGEVAELLSCSQRTVEREWRLARALLRTHLRHG